MIDSSANPVSLLVGFPSRSSATTVVVASRPPWKGLLMARRRGLWSLGATPRIASRGPPRAPQIGSNGIMGGMRINSNILLRGTSSVTISRRARKDIGGPIYLMKTSFWSFCLLCAIDGLGSIFLAPEHHGCSFQFRELLRQVSNALRERKSSNFRETSISERVILPFSAGKGE